MRECVCVEIELSRFIARRDSTVSRFTPPRSIGVSSSPACYIRASLGESCRETRCTKGPPVEVVLLVHVRVAKCRAGEHENRTVNTYFWGSIQTSVVVASLKLLKPVNPLAKTSKRLTLGFFASERAGIEPARVCA